MSHPTTLGGWLRSRRKSHGLTQDDLARQIGCAAITIRKIESDDRRPSLDLAEGLADALEVPSAERAVFLQVAVGEAPLHLLLGRARSNLPRPLAALIGREEALAQAERLIERQATRLLTITGPGGIGKTSFSLHLADRLSAHYPDGCYVVDLTTLQDSTQLPVAIAEAMGIATPQPHRALSALWEELREQAVLIVLDNFEHVAAARTIIDTLLKECLWVQLLVTSREPLHLRQEQVFVLDTLELPPAVPPPTRETIAAASAVTLFVARAQASQPGFALTAQNAAAVADLCRRLDGMPLAIELVAAQCALYSPAEILDRLGQRLPHLRDQLVDRPPRHQTVYDAMSWGYDLLTPPEQQLFAQLAVFVGGWTLAAVEAICGDEPAPAPVAHDGAQAASPVLHTLISLLTKSLIAQQQTAEGEVRFRMLTLLQSFARERLAGLGLEEQTRRRHARFYAALGDQLRQRPDESLLIAQQVEYENMRAALHWALTHDEPDLAQRIDGGLDMFYQRTLATLSQTQALNAQLERLVAERTAELEAALRAVEQREQHLHLANTALLRASQAAEAAEAAKTHFLQLLSHELNTVLTVIVGFSQIIPRYGPLTERQKGLLERIHANSQQFIRLFTAVSDLLSLERGPLALQYSATDLRALLPEVIEAVAAANPASAITVRWESAAALIVETDATRLKDAIAQMLQACITWSTDGLIDVVAQAEPTALLLRVQSYGSSLAVEDRVEFFEPFRMQVKHNQPLALNTLVGLALGRQIATMQGGSLVIESEERSTALVLRLPLASPGA